MARKTKEWVGKTDDSSAPEKVRLRVFDREKGLCHLCALPIQQKKWDLDHVVALINGGENREGNLKPVHRDCHKAKTVRDVAEKARVAAIRARHIGARAPAKIKLRGQGFTKAEKVRAEKSPLPVRLLYRIGELAKPVRKK